VDLERLDRLPVRAGGRPLRAAQRHPVHPVVSERREPEEDLDSPAVGVVDEVSDEVLLNVLVVLVVPPGGGERLRLKPPAVQRITRFPPSDRTASMVAFQAARPNVGVRVRVR